MRRVETPDVQRREITARRVDAYSNFEELSNPEYRNAQYANFEQVSNQGYRNAQCPTSEQATGYRNTQYPNYEQVSNQAYRNEQYPLEQVANPGYKKSLINSITSDPNASTCKIAVNWCLLLILILTIVVFSLFVVYIIFNPLTKRAAPSPKLATVLDTIPEKEAPITEIQTEEIALPEISAEVTTEAEEEEKEEKEEMVEEKEKAAEEAEEQAEKGDITESNDLVKPETVGYEKAPTTAGTNSTLL